MTGDRSARNVSPDPLLEALVELARSAIANRRAATERRAKMHIVARDTPARRGGQAA